MSYSLQLFGLFIIAIPIACISWTLTHEEFREFRAWCTKNGELHPKLAVRKFFYMLTCEFCFSHYVTLAFLLITRFKTLFDDWRGYIISGFALVWVANIYMNVYGRIRLDIKREQTEISSIREDVEESADKIKVPWDIPLKPSLAQQKACVESY